RAPDPALDDHERRLLVGALELRVAVGVAGRELDAVKAVDEVDVPPVAAELAVGDRLQPDRLLERDRLADALVLDRAQRGRVDLALLRLCARGMELLRAQQAADMIRPKRRLRRLSHLDLPIQQSHDDKSGRESAATGVIQPADWALAQWAHGAEPKPPAAIT